jgi:putative pre-16S rRNA nuclease
MGIDYGERRIGLSVSDPTATIAVPLPVLIRRRGKRPPFKQILHHITEYDVEGIIVGLPLTPAAGESDWTREVREFAARLAERAGLPVWFRDERTTSARAERAIRSLGLPKRRRERKDLVDQAAAILILQSFLDRRKMLGDVAPDVAPGAVTPPGTESQPAAPPDERKRDGLSD